MEYRTKLRLRMSAKDAHYGGNLVDGAHMIHLFGDVATELLIMRDGDEGLFRAYDQIDFLAPVYAGDYIEVAWLPNRRCVFRYEGDAHFLVTEAVNTKLQAGDQFDTACFLVGKPMYIDRLIRENEPPTAYVAGAKNGLSNVRKL